MTNKYLIRVQSKDGHHLYIGHNGLVEKKSDARKWNYKRTVSEYIPIYKLTYPEYTIKVERQ